MFKRLQITCVKYYELRYMFKKFISLIKANLKTETCKLYSRVF